MRVTKELALLISTGINNGDNVTFIWSEENNNDARLMKRRRLSILYYLFVWCTWKHSLFLFFLLSMFHITCRHCKLIKASQSSHCLTFKLSNCWSVEVTDDIFSQLFTLKFLYQPKIWQGPFLAAKTALEAPFSLVNQSKSVMPCNFRQCDCLSVRNQVESHWRKLQSITSYKFLSVWFRFQ